MEKTFPRLVQTGEGFSISSTGTDMGGKFMEKTFPRLVQTGEGSSINSAGTKFVEKTPPLAASDGGKLLHKFDSKQNPA